MGMEYVQKALDTVAGANLIREDLSATISIQEGHPRPVLENAPQVKATAPLHQWNEQGLIGPGNGVASYADGSAPTADVQDAVRESNPTCRVGKTASVTDDMIASWTGGGEFTLADGQLESKLQSALDFQTEIKTREVLDECEWMHVSGNSAVTSGFPGGQTDGLVKWILANGTTYTPATATGSAPVDVAESFVRDAMRSIAEKYPTAMPNRLLAPPELISDFNNFTGSGAGNPIVRVLPSEAQTTNFIGGAPRLKFYDTGYGLVEVCEEPNLSPAFNPLLSGLGYENILLYNDKQVKHAALRPLAAEMLARVGTSLQKMITTTFAQEHRVGIHAGVIQYVKSAVA